MRREFLTKPANLTCAKFPTHAGLSSRAEFSIRAEFSTRAECLTRADSATRAGFPSRAESSTRAEISTRADFSAHADFLNELGHAIYDARPNLWTFGDAGNLYPLRETFLSTLEWMQCMCTREELEYEMPGQSVHGNP